MDLKLEAKQNQTLSQRMIQSAEILQMTAEELNTYINELTLENPVIDMVSPATPAARSPSNSASGLIPLMRKIIISISVRTTMMNTILKTAGTSAPTRERLLRTISGPS